jgi:lysophospholipase L1-like esterase
MVRTRKVSPMPSVQPAPIRGGGGGRGPRGPAGTGISPENVTEVQAGENLQAAIDAASAGDIVIRYPGASRVYDPKADVSILNMDNLSRSPQHVYNPSGLKYWKALRGRAKLGQGSVDVIGVGDSFTRGHGITNYLHFGWFAALRKKGQAAWNPTGVKGGLGWFPAKLFTGIPGITADGTLWNNDLNDKTMPGGYGYRSAQGASLGTYTITTGANLGLDPNDAGTVLPYLSDLEVVLSCGQSYYGSVNFQMDEAVGAFSDTGLTVTPASAAAALKTGMRTGRDSLDQGFHHAATPTTGAYRYQIVSVDKATKYMDLNALIHYDGDWDCGVRFHNLGFTGAQARKFVPDTVAVNGSTMGEGSTTGVNPIWDFDNPEYCIDTGANNKRVGLIIISLGVNEYQATDAAQNHPIALYNSLKDMLTRIKALRFDIATPKPCSVLLVPQWQIAKTGAAADINDDAKTHRWAEYVQKMYDLADEFSDFVAVCDIFELTGRSLKLSTNTTNPFVDDTGMYQSDKLHPNVIGAEFYAQAIFEALI